MRHTTCYFMMILLLCFTQCKDPIKVNKTAQESNYDKGQVTFYGAYYATNGIEQNVVSLDIYSKDLSLDSAGYMVGTGVNLYISDIFLPQQDTMLVESSYIMDTTGRAFTFIPGVNFDGTISGAYILTVTDGSLVNTEIFEDGSFQVGYKGDSVLIEFLLKKESGEKYAANFKGELPYYDGR